MRRLPLLAAVSLLAVACAAETVIPQTTTTVALEEPSTTTTTPSGMTTTTVGEQVVDICRGRAVAFAPGGTYLAGCFIEPVVFQTKEDGWWSSSAGDDWILVRWRDSADPNYVVWVGAIAVNADEAPTSVMEGILAIDGIEAVSDRSAVTVVGRPGLSVDVEGAEEQRAGQTSPCTAEGSAISFLTDEQGYAIGQTAYSKGAIGVGACDVARIWVLGVNERTITIIGGTADPDRHEEAVAKIEELFEGMSFDAGGGS